ncbi:MAG: 6-carboxytetrahydropterin synthase [Gemmatimonadaceae bacterium]|nr:6-carboxytetrahydropterin synthase [Gemmatimonadaceae bacterium]
MAKASLTRRTRFSAAHRYSRPDWSRERNEQTFGACAWPNFHGHSYTCDVSVNGDIAADTGFVADLGMLDALLYREVHQRFDHRNINLDIPEFGEGKLIPSGENLARFIFEKLQAGLTPDLKLESVTIAEDDTLSATYRGGN